MATAQTIINRALRLAKVIDSQGAADSSEAQDALDVLNAMLAEWHEAEVGLPEYSLADLTTALATDAADTEAIAHALAMRLSGEYGTEMSPITVEIANSTMARLRLRYFQPGVISSDLPWPQQNYDIEAG